MKYCLLLLCLGSPLYSQEPLRRDQPVEQKPGAHHGLEPSGKAIGIFAHPPAEWGERQEEPLFVDGEPRDAAKTFETDRIVSVSVYAVADEEYRAAHSDWQSRLYQIIETADNDWYRHFGINWVIQGYFTWTSDGGSTTSLLADLATDASLITNGLVIGFTADSNFAAGGIAYVYASDPCVGFSLYLDQDIASNAASVAQEVQHNYGCSSHDKACATLISQRTGWFQCTP